MAATVSTDAGIGSRDVKELLEKIKKRLDQVVDDTNMGVNQAIRATIKGKGKGKGDGGPYINPNNLCMIATLQAVNGALRDSGIHLLPHQSIPDFVEELIKKTAVLTIENLHNRDYEYEQKYPGRMAYGLHARSVDPDKIDLHLEDIARLEINLLSPFAKIPLRQRWRMCLDPDRVRVIGTHIKSARDNSLLPFMFDNEPGYLHLSMLGDPNILDGWSTEEIMVELEKGQARVAEWSDGDSGKNIRANSPGGLKDKLSRFFNS